MYTTTVSTPAYDYAQIGIDFGVWGIIALVLALVGGILAYFLFVRPDTKPNGKFLQALKDFLAFKIMWLEPIMKVAYYVMTLYTILASFALIPYSFLAFITVLIGGPVLIRVIYEATMMFIMIWRNTRDIAKNAEKKA